jgi:signal transduction histidine kinase
VIRILTEAISNAARHAGATRLRVALVAKGDSVVMQVGDNGRGFDASRRAASESGGIGLDSMAERAKALGGELRLESAPGRGTLVEAGFR